jgi:cation diffusion facilitator family transporter
MNPLAAEPPRHDGAEGDEHPLRDAARRGIKATIAALMASVLLGAIKIAAGVLGNSYALIADGVESLLDVFASLVVWGALRIGVSTPSRRYPYGLGKVEPLAGMVVATMLILAAVGIAAQAARGISNPHPGPAPFTLVVLVVVVATKEGIFRMLSRRGQEIGSRAVTSDAWHHRSDALTSLAAFIGISLALVFGDGYESADDWAALFACGVIVYNGVKLFRAGLDEVLDAAAPSEVEQRIRAVALGVDGTRGIETCRVRRSGLGLLVDIHVEVDGELPVRAGHRIAHRVKDALMAGDLGILDVLVHVEPHGERRA